MITDKEALVLAYCKKPKQQLKEKIVLTYKPLVEYIARKLAYDKNELEDINQIGTIGLIRALDRFDPKKETDFSTFATPTIIGEIRHYFRDKRNLVRMPRKLQELYNRIKTYIRETQSSGHSPTVKEIAKALQVDEERVLEAMEAKHATSIVSLDAPPSLNDFYSGSSSHGQTWLDSLDLSTKHKDDHYINDISLKEAIQKLEPRLQQIVLLRYFRGLSQFEIAARLNLSQMHISRLITRAHKQLRRYLKDK